MSGDLLVRRWTRPAVRASVRGDMLLLAPAVPVVGVAAWRLGNLAAGLVVTIVAGAAIAVLAVYRARRFDRRWLIAALDAARPDVEDSGDLLFADPAGLGPLQRLQRRRIEARLADAPFAPETRGRAPWAIVAVWLFALATVALLLSLAGDPAATLAPAREGLPAAPGVPQLVGQRLRVTPPAYTGLPPRLLGTLDARVPAGSRLEWTLDFAPAPASARLATLGGGAVPLVREGALWAGRRVADRAFLYRVLPAGGAARPVPPLHRIDVVADRPPQVRLIDPATTLNQAAPGQRRWRIAFEASDDHGVRPAAALRLVLAQGEGENIRFSERTLTLSGSGAPTQRLFAATLDLAAFGFTEAGDLVAQLTVSDLRQPQPQQVRGPSVILRRPAPRGVEGGGLEGMTRRVMPAYFRSQRQVIIDIEALLAERPRPPADRFLARSDGIGADQAMLRLRYGQFMGEETGGGASSAMPTSDAEEGTPAAAPHGDGHDHAASAAPAFGDAAGIVEAVGHTHDEAEAATLLDPGTRANLRQALDAMRASELALRQGAPRQALPHAYRALRFIKVVQQATRIFLQRTGTRLPPIDLSRRLTGDRKDLAAGALAASPAPPVDATPTAIWQALGEGADPAALDALDRWSRAGGGRIDDPLALAAALDRVRRDPACAACRERLRGALWRALVRPAPGLGQRRAGDAAGRRYLEALR